MKKWLFLSIVTFLLSSLIYSTEPNEQRSITLNIEDAVAMALNNNLGIKIEELNVDRQKWDVWTSWNIFIPKTSMTAAFSRLNKDEDDREVSVLTPSVTSFNPMTGAFDEVSVTTAEIPEWGVGLSVDMSFALNASMGFAVYQTVLDLQSGQLTLEEAKRKVERDTKKSFYQLLLLKENVELMRQNLSAAERRYLQAVELTRYGQMPRLNMLNAQVAFENLKPALIEMENGYASAMMGFKNMIGISRNTDLTLEGSLDICEICIDRDEIRSLSESRRFDILKLDQSIRSLENLRNIHISGLTPTFILRFSADPSFQKDPATDDWFGDTDYMTDNWKQRSGMLMLGISMPIDSWFPFSSAQMNIVETNYNIERMRITREQILRGNEIEVETILMALEKSIRNMEALRLNVAISEEAYKLSEEAYRTGGKDLVELQGAELEYKKALNNLLREKYNFNVGLLDLEYIINQSIRKTN